MPTIFDNTPDGKLFDLEVAVEDVTKDGDRSSWSDPDGDDEWNDPAAQLARKISDECKVQWDWAGWDQFLADIRAERASRGI